MGSVLGRGAVAGNLAPRVHRHGDAVRATEGPEIDHPTRRRPRERVRVLLVQGRVAVPDDLAARIHGQGEAGAAEGAEIDHVHEKAWSAALPAVKLSPTTSPRAFTA